MIDYAKYADPCLGNGEINLPKPEGIAAAWFFLKAQTGNTHPGACFPFGMVSVCPYSGAYVTGYGLNKPSCDGKVKKLYDKYYASGFAHFQHSGTGMIKKYYNYFKVMPLTGGIDERHRLWELENEQAQPGYYYVGLQGGRIGAELTVAEKMAFHRYTFRNSGRRNLLIEFSSGGLSFEGMKTYPEKAEVRVVNANAVAGFAKMLGVCIYVYMELEGRSLGCSLWHGENLIYGGGFEMEYKEDSRFKHFGAIFELPEGMGEKVAYGLRIGFSLISVRQAKENMETVSGKSFDDVFSEAYGKWNEYLNSISVEGGTRKQKTVFYSALYHSLIKPCDFSGESPFWPQKEYYVDIATMWDQYKTQLPLVLTLFPERGRDIVNSMLAAAEYAGEFPSDITLSDHFSEFINQARALCHYTIADAFYRKVEGIDWNRAKNLMIREINLKRNRDFVEKGFLQKFTHTLDLAGACFCTAQIADYLRDYDTYRKMMKLSENWKNVYGEDGILGEADYYEGGAWNYSFRPLHNMRERIGLSKGRFIEQLDRFFGYGAPPVRQPGDTEDPEYKDHMQRGYLLNRFEGFNNQSDMETPYAYIYGGRHDRTAEVVRAGLKYMFTTGRGGLPGNDDSGGLSSCCLCNMIGLFPVAGQPYYLIGSPVFDKIELNTGVNTFIVKTENNSDKNIYIRSAVLNGKDINRAYITVGELMAGGELVLSMSERPAEWASEQLPPSYGTYNQRKDSCYKDSLS